MKIPVRPEFPTASVGSSQAPTAAVENSAPLATRPQSTYKSGKAVQTSEATSICLHRCSFNLYQPMPAFNSSLTLGSPRFSDTRLAGLANTQGPLAAWHEAVTRDARQAAAGVTGDFAVGLHVPDGRIFLAVDRFAIHTLCYRVVDGQLRFAARADELADASTPIDPQAIFDYLYFHVIPSPRTIYKGIYRLPPGALCAV